MGNSCSFGQGRKGSDSISEKSEESNRHQQPQSDTKHPHDVDEKKGQYAPSSQQGSDVTGRISQVTSSGESGRAGSGIAPKALQEISHVCDTVSTPSPVVKEFGTKLENVVLSEMPPKLQDMDPTQILLLRGKLGADKCRRRLKKIVLFVLSADGKDSVQERTELAENILKSLRLKFSKQDFEIHLVDTNCDDVSNVQARLFAETRKWELKRHSDQCYLVPILLLNSTFGQQLVPFTIEIGDFEEVLSKLENDKSKELMSKLYQKVTKDKETMYELQNLKSSDLPSDVQDLIKDLSALWPQDKVLKYLTTALEDLLNEVMKNHEDLLKNMIWLNRMSTASFNADAEVQKKLMGIVQELKKQVPEKNILKHSPKPSDNHDPANVVQQISAQLLTALTNPIASLIQDHGQTCLAKPSLGVSASLFNNIEKQIPEDLLDASDSEDLQKILKYLKSDANHPLVVSGGSFSGKSVLLKMVAQKVVAGSEFFPVDGNLVCRFEDLNSGASLVQVLEDVADRCKILQDGEATSCKHDLQSYSTIITTSLQSTRKPLLIILDGLDRHQPVDVSWIPQTLSTNVKIIISATHNTSKIGDQDDQCRFYDSLKNRLDDKCFLSIGDLGKRALAPVFNKEYLDISQDEFAKTEDQTKLIYDKVVSFITKLAKEFLEFDVVNVLALLVASRAGLLETEILDLLTGCDKLKGTQKQTYDAASVFWTKLYRRMEPFFLHKRDCVSFKNQLVKQAIEHSFKDSIKLGHQILFDYFSGESPSNSSEFYKTDNATNSYDRFISRKHLELPYHHYHLQGTENFINSDYLTTHEWIYKKLLTCQTSALLDDLDLVNSSSSNQHLTILRDFLTLNKKQLDYDTRQLYSLLDIYFESKQDFSKMNGVHHGQVKIKRKFSNNVVQSWYEACKKPPVCTLVVQNLDDLVARDDDTKVAVGFTALQRLGNGDTGYVTSLSTEREEICVWDVSRCKRVRTLTGITQPLSLCPVDSTRCIVLCGRELRLFNLDLGSSLVKLKGVMNQKMPFYGLHDNGHVVCLSRNRMYVNLMNLESGDCVTTFKAGEDRFLNSLLVSGDGRILVCGDETQKPFPLLVWHLTSRKLLYDLRIPHHDFVTSLAAITFEGNYVCVVCRETTEPSPNFIVVYDLQSGTLFKKWKPLCDTVALEISSADGSVVSGLQDARILVWDLITGNCRHTLVGHTAPVTSLRLDPTGGMLLSSDSQCRDKSIRLWDLNNGSMLAVFTPTAKITSCEIIQKGQFITLALEDHKNIIVLKLVRPEDEAGDEDAKDQVYGLPENDGKVFNLKEGA